LGMHGGCTPRGPGRGCCRGYRGAERPAADMRQRGPYTRRGRPTDPRRRAPRCRPVSYFNRWPVVTLPIVASILRRTARSTAPTARSARQGRTAWGAFAFGCRANSSSNDSPAHSSETGNGRSSWLEQILGHPSARGPRKAQGSGAESGPREAPREALPSRGHGPGRADIPRPVSTSA